MIRLINKMAGLREAVAKQSPLVHNITNYVVMHYTANALLAVGASPVMAHAAEEVEEMTALAQALVINIGTLSTPWIDAMFLAGRAANRLGKPVILDPVGAGATRFRTNTALRLLDEVRVSVLRGNASEILALSGEKSQTRGVDSMDSAGDAQSAASRLANKFKMTVAMTGAVDCVTDGSRTILVSNGHPLMGRITGSGCAASALAGAFCGVEPDALVAVAAALVAFGIAGESAAQRHPSPGSFSIALIDELYKINSQKIIDTANISYDNIH
jgi:hydroxyethylthiazole kinase